MKKNVVIIYCLTLLIPFLHSGYIQAKTSTKYYDKSTAAWKNNIPPRLQWNENFGYCGEVSVISAGLFYGQYISQYTARAIASPNIPQNLAKSQLMLGVNAESAATKMHLKSVAWDTDEEHNTPQFLAWVKHNVLAGYPVIIGVFTNEFLFYGKTNPSAGDSEFDHIVLVYGIGSNHSLKDDSYYPDDVIYFSDNGLWGSAVHPPYLFNYPFALFQSNRKQANNKNGTIYSLSNNGTNYGLVVKGVIDLNGDTLPVRVDTNLNDERPEIKEGTSIPPTPTPLTLTITVSDLVPGIPYILYRYNDFDHVPNSNFNAQSTNAYEKWNIQINAGSTFVMTEEIQSNEIAIYRAVKATAP